MITQLRLQNWKSFKDSLIYIDPLTFLIGTNASGKSNVLDAFDFLQRLFSPHYSLDDAIGSIRGGRDWIVRKGEKNFLLEVTIEEEGVTHTISVGVERTENGFVYSVKPDMRKKVNNQIRNIFILNPTPESMRGYSPLSAELKPDGSNIAGVIAAMPKEDKARLEDTLTKYIRPLPEKDIKRIEAVTVGLTNQDAMLYCYEEWNPDQPVDARGMSDGTLRFAAIIVALLTIKKGSLLIIEEVDNGLHPSRAKELVKVLKEISEERNVDVLCTTHNPVLIDELGNEIIPFISFVKRDKEGNSYISLLEEKVHLAKLMASGTIGDLIKNDEL